jgi:uncharacterized protein YqcC (DUF446 family)
VTKHIKVASLLIDIEMELRQTSLWQQTLPAVEALRSREPFCVDTLDFNQWLQFIFLPRMHQLIEAQQALPGACSIAPMAEESLQGVVGIERLLAVLLKLDRLLTP